MVSSGFFRSIFFKLYLLDTFLALAVAQPPEAAWAVLSQRDLAESSGFLQTALGPQGDVFVTGPSVIFDWSVPNHHSGEIDFDAAYVARLDSAGKPVWTTAIGEAAGRIVLDRAGFLYLHGTIRSNAFSPTLGAVRGVGSDFVCKLQASDGAVRFCARLDSTTYSLLAADANGVYMVGEPQPPYLVPTPGAVNLGRRGIYVTKLSPEGDRVVFRAQFSGSAVADRVHSVALDPQGNLWLAGEALTDDYPVTPDAELPAVGRPVNLNSPAGFLTLLSADGSQLLYSTYLERMAAQVALGGGGNVYVVMEDYRSGDPPLVLRGYRPNGRPRIYERQGPNSLLEVRLAVDEQGAASILGTTQRVDFSTLRATETCHFGEDNPAGFLFRVAPDGTVLQSTFVDTPKFQFAFSATTSRAFIALWVVPGNTFPLPRPAVLRVLELGPGVQAPLALACVGSAASLRGAPLSPGEIVSLFGAGLGPAQGVAAVPQNERYPTNVAGTEVTVDDIPAAVLYASDSQVNAVMPWNGGSKVCVRYQGARSNCIFVPVANTSAAIFRLVSGDAAIVNQDGTINSPEHPAPNGSVVSLYATGLGRLEPTPVNGAILDAAPNSLVWKPAVHLAPPERNLVYTADILYAGPAPGQVAGLFQINVRVKGALGPTMSLLLGVEDPDGNVIGQYDRVVLAVVPPQ